MTTLLSSDWHLDDQPINEYRWNIFNVLRDTIKKFNVHHVYILGDLTDRKDRHSGTLVNKLIQALGDLPVRPMILLGNHDLPLAGTPFWSVLNATNAAKFITEPWFDKSDSVLWLPYVHDPNTAWRDIRFYDNRLVLMHQTIAGAVGNNGHKIEGDRLPLLSRRLNVWSGDVHTPQRIGAIEYVGSPHAVKFGDNYKTRFVLLNDDMRFKQEIILHGIQKAVLTINSIRDLARAELHSNDQIRIHYNLPMDQVAEWPKIRDQIREWTIDREVLLVSIDTVVDVDMVSGKRQRKTIESTHEPLTVFKAFCDSEKLSSDLTRSGLSFLQEAGYAND